MGILLDKYNSFFVSNGLTRIAGFQLDTDNEKVKLFPRLNYSVNVCSGLLWNPFLFFLSLKNTKCQN
jgi:hypothetical protein